MKGKVTILLVDKTDIKTETITRKRSTPRNDMICNHKETIPQEDKTIVNMHSTWEQPNT